jgi:transcription elongation factor Elf1
MLVGDPAVYVPTSAGMPVAVCHPCGKHIATTFAVQYEAPQEVFDRLEEVDMRLEVASQIDPEIDEQVEPEDSAESDVDDTGVSTATAVFQRASTSEW